MAISEIGNKVSEAFHREFKTGDKSHTKNFSREEIKRTMAEFYADRGLGFYKLMEDRVAEIDNEAQYQRERNDKRKDILKDKVLTFTFGLISGLILMWLGFKYFTGNTP